MQTKTVCCQLQGSLLGLVCKHLCMQTYVGCQERGKCPVFHRVKGSSPILVHNIRVTVTLSITDMWESNEFMPCNCSWIVYENEKVVCVCVWTRRSVQYSCIYLCDVHTCRPAWINNLEQRVEDTVWRSTHREGSEVTCRKAWERVIMILYIYI